MIGGEETPRLFVQSSALFAGARVKDGILSGGAQSSAGLAYKCIRAPSFMIYGSLKVLPVSRHTQ